VKHRDTELWTLTTQVFGESQLFITAESWIQVRLRLQTAGPVAVSTREDIVPVLSGRGALLEDDEDTVFVMQKGDRLFYACQAVNRVRVIIEPIPAVPVVAQPQLEAPVPTPTPPPPEAPPMPRPRRGSRRRKPTRWP
jgi:hypothetical protein